MIKLLIADDESLVCVGVRSFLKWEELGVEVVGTAHNGRQASEMIESLRPDIVICDIQMPVKSGLDLLEECAEKYGNIPLFIMLTSFEDFEYARRAMKAQAVDYLTKLELNAETLRASVQKALGLLSRYQTYSAAEPDNSQKLLREKFFLQLYNNLFENEARFASMQREAKLDFSAPAYVAAICELAARDKPGAVPRDSAEARIRVREMAEETLGKKIPCYTSELDSVSFLITFCLPERSPSAQKEMLEQALDKMIGMVKNYLNISLRVAVGHIVAEPRELTESYQSAKRVMRNTSEKSPLFFMERQSYARQLVRQIQQYILEHLGEKLSQNDVASEFNVSSGYLSQLFSKYMDIGFVEYITNARILAAKDMLAQSDMRINEIASALGFENAFYFSNVFKKSEGVSPREYRQKLGGRGDG